MRGDETLADVTATFQTAISPCNFAMNRIKIDRINVGNIPRDALVKKWGKNGGKKNWYELELNATWCRSCRH